MRPIPGASSENDLFLGMEEAGDVAVNRYNGGVVEKFGFGAHSTIGDYEPTTQGERAVLTDPSAITMYGLAGSAASEALNGPDLTGGANHFTVGPGDYSAYFHEPMTRQFGPFRSFDGSTNNYIRIYGGTQ